MRRVFLLPFSAFATFWWLNALLSTCHKVVGLLISSVSLFGAHFLDDPVAFEVLFKLHLHLWCCVFGDASPEDFNFLVVDHIARILSSPTLACTSRSILLIL